MKPQSSQVVFLAAAGVLAVGGVVASQLFMAPPKYTGPNTEQILATSQRLQGGLPKVPDADALYATNRSAGVTAIRRAVVNQQPQPARQTRNVQEVTAPAPVRPITSAPTPVSRTPAPAPGSNLALTGIGGSGNNREALVFNLADQKRESGKIGDTLFGFTLAAIHDRAVDLKQGSAQVTLRMGEKSSAVEAALASQVASGATSVVGSTPSGTGSVAPVNASGTPGGRGDWRARMAASAVQANFNRGGGNRGGGRNGNNNNRRRNSTTQSGARRYSNGPNSSSRYSTVSSGGSNRNSGFRAGGFGFGGGRGRGGQNNQIQLEATSNPQEARRTGAPLIGDVEALFEPEAFTNPQTERRTGGTSGQAFGNNSGNQGGNNRGGGFGNTGRANGGRSTGNRTGTMRG